MADETTASRTMTRDELAEYLHGLAREFEGEGDADIAVGNKRVTLSPAAQIDCDVAINERSAVLGSDSQTVDVELSWTPE